ncbi:hypothetical protein ACFJGV_15215 [Cnuibacter sp. UC19_7]|uniref:hypothetical protein n=1 Tax=Cnuibacter sp. UC19_7 TaxID=3350166 RepID=UPI00366F6D42
MSNALSALWASIVRTIVPLVVGAVVSYLVSKGVTLDEQFEPLLGTALTVAFSGLYYIAVRLLETYVTPKLGWLLGLAKTPTDYTAESPAKQPHEADPTPVGADYTPQHAAPVDATPAENPKNAPTV